MSVGFAQNNELPIDPTSNKINFNEVVKVNESTKANDIYDRAFAWVQSKKYKMISSDKASGTIVCEATAPVVYPGPRVGMNDKGIVKFIITISAKDGRYRYEMTNFKHEGAGGKGNGGNLELAKAECGKYVLPDAGWAKIKKDTPAIVKDIITDLKVGIEPQGAPAPLKSDW